MKFQGPRWNIPIHHLLPQLDLLLRGQVGEVLKGHHLRANAAKGVLLVA